MTSEQLASRWQDVTEGVKKGLDFAVGLTLLAVVALVIPVVSGKAPILAALAVWGLSILFYVFMGVVGGALYGLLRPIQHRYIGRYLTTFLILFLAHAIVIVILLPLKYSDLEIGRLSLILFGVALVCLVLAPFYLAIARRFS